jgi:hypothetical protein
MKTYTFELDRKITMWYREYHEVEANTMEEAEAIMKENAFDGRTENTFVYQDALDDSITDTGDFEILNPETKETIYSNLL